MKRALGTLGALAVVAVGAGWILTAPAELDARLTAELASATGDVARGEQVFWAGGCASCHTAPEADDEEKLILAGGQEFASPFGTFMAPNISTDPDHGIGGWSLDQFALALTEGVSADGQHLYPAFPYTAYRHMTAQDIADLKAFMDTLPASETSNQPHDLGFPFNLRRALGVWKALYLSDDWVMDAPTDEQVTHGRYLAEALAHCGECHTRRDLLGGLDTARWMGGAPNPAGRGTIPNITPGGLDWSAADIAYYLETGFTPDFDTAGGHMVPVIENFARLSGADREAVAAYLKALPPVTDTP